MQSTGCQVNLQAYCFLFYSHNAQFSHKSPKGLTTWTCQNSLSPHIHDGLASVSEQKWCRVNYWRMRKTFLFLQCGLHCGHVTSSHQWISPYPGSWMQGGKYCDSNSMFFKFVAMPHDDHSCSVHQFTLTFCWRYILLFQFFFFFSSAIGSEIFGASF